ncbi:murein transglycosylase A [Oceaniovalibus sp. ACAM 378]|uniref:murein transglycosylase A n=1 Tax=Oceaniovalibus sp. ACAM 378 TaxID=2599923 RepID=UPI0011DA6DE0|nr:murein transglycosylase [Oceaniovalibus sp. ACAM 378]
MIRAVVAAWLAGLVSMTTPPPALAETTHKILSFSDLNGWQNDDHAEALSVFIDTCRDMRDPEWRSVCAVAASQTNARTFFELFFRPVLIEDGDPMLFTGYYEPELSGSRFRGGKYQYPLYGLPGDADQGQPWHSRAAIETEGVMEEKGLELAWIDDPVDVYFLHVQGSGRVKLAEGGGMRVGYAGKNGHSYRSIGKELIRRGTFPPHAASAQAIRAWVKANPEDGAELMRHNPSYVFFREVSEVPADRGPLGAMNRSITTLRSVAVDPRFTPLGAPVWIEKGGREPMRRLMIAQDTGSAIKGAQRADIFFGTGRTAGLRAGRVKDRGRMIVLMPIQRAYALAPGF